MKKNFIIHGIWLVIAAAAFAAGSILFPSLQPGANSGDSSPDKLIGKRGSQSAGTPRATAKSTDDSASDSGEAAGFPGSAATATFETKRVYSSDDMRDAILKAIQEPNPVKSNLMFAQLLDQLTPENVEAAIETFRENANDPSMFRQIGLFTYAWGAMDGGKAVDYAQNLDGRGAIFGTSSALSGWASANPQEAIDWLQGQEVEGMEKAMYARGLINGLAQTDLGLATEFALSVDDGQSTLR